MYGEEDSCIQGFGGESYGRDHLENLSVDGKIKWIFEKWDGVQELH
jgi:hypothetical protein